MTHDDMIVMVLFDQLVELVGDVLGRFELLQLLPWEIDDHLDGKAVRWQ